MKQKFFLYFVSKVCLLSMVAFLFNLPLGGISEKESSKLREIPIVFSDQELSQLQQPGQVLVYLGTRERQAILSLSEQNTKIYGPMLAKCAERIEQGCTTLKLVDLVSFIKYFYTPEDEEKVEYIEDDERSIKQLFKTVLWCPLVLSRVSSEVRDEIEIPGDDEIICEIGLSLNALHELVMNVGGIEDVDTSFGIRSFSSKLLVPEELFPLDTRALSHVEIISGRYKISGVNWTLTPFDAFFDKIKPFVADGIITLDGDLKVTGDSEFEGDVIMEKTLYINKIDPVKCGTTFFSGHVETEDGKNVTVGGDLHVTGTSQLDGDVTMLSGLEVIGTTSLKDDVIISRTLYVDKIDPLDTETTLFSGHVETEDGKDLTVGGDLHVKGATQLDGPLSPLSGLEVNGDVVISQTLYVNQIDPATTDSILFSGHITTTNKNMILGGDLHVTGTSHFSDDVKMLSG
jgi:hypothetical protein